MEIKTITQLNDLEYEVVLHSEEGEETQVVLADTLIQLQLLKPQVISLLQYQQLKQDYATAYRQAINYLSYRLRSCAEVATYLATKGHEPQQINQVIERLKMQKYLDDQLFAEAFVRTALLDLKQGPKKISQTLRQKFQIDQIAIEAGLSHYSNDQIIENCQKLIEKLLRMNKKFTGNALKRQIVQKIYGYGYDHAVIEVAWQRLDHQEDETDTQDVFEQQAQKVYRRIQRETNRYKRKQKFQQKMYQLGFSQAQSQNWFQNQEEENENN
ncbi:MAG: RecX family transcriptional regulator [Culicoidibacterales bacterium]